MQAVYITTTLPYVNGEPHIGFGTEIIRADVLARYHRGAGREVFFNTGTDEHGQKLFDKAQELGMTAQEYVDLMSKNFVTLMTEFNISQDRFIRTTDSDHKLAAQKFWEICNKNGYIYKKNYQTKYCVGCELEKQDSDLEDGKCPVHPNMQIQNVDEENYFFAWSKFERALLEYYEINPDFVKPDFRFNEIKSFVRGGIHDFSISRLKEKMSWGVAVPGDDEHVMYVWFDALVNYISTLGWGSSDESKFEKFWTNGFTIQFCGKDNLRQQTAMWQGMLFAAGVKPTDVVYINGFINVDGQKMSKSLGNVVQPHKLKAVYGTDAVRYFVTRHVHNHEDSDFTYERFHEAYMGNLVNGIGNLVSRVLTMSATNGVTIEVNEDDLREQSGHSLLEGFDYNGEMNRIWQKIKDADQFITEQAPFKKIKENKEAGEEDIRFLLEKVWEITLLIEPVMPETSQKIRDCLNENKKPESPLFPRIEFNRDSLI